MGPPYEEGAKAAALTASRPLDEQLPGQLDSRNTLDLRKLLRTDWQRGAEASIVQRGSATVLTFPGRRRERIEVAYRRDPSTGCRVWIFDVVTGDGRRACVARRESPDDAAADIDWWRRGGVEVVELGSGVPS